MRTHLCLLAAALSVFALSASAATLDRSDAGLFITQLDRAAALTDTPTLTSFIVKNIQAPTSFRFVRSLPRQPYAASAAPSLKTVHSNYVPRTPHWLLL